MRKTLPADGARKGGTGSRRLEEFGDEQEQGRGGGAMEIVLGPPSSRPMTEKRG